MDIWQYKSKYPNDVLIIIEEFNKKDKYVIFDFLNSDELADFITLTEIEIDESKGTMILFRNYNGKTLTENTVYPFKQLQVEFLKSQFSSNNLMSDSFLISYSVDLQGNTNQFFGDSLTNDKPEMVNLDNDFIRSSLLKKVPFPSLNKSKLVVRNVKQGNWNEIWTNNNVEIVFDIGTSTNADKQEVRNLINTRTEEYSKSKPILIISHWDKDHYHSLLGFTDEELSNSFKSILCRKNPPNRTSQNLFSRLIKTLGNNHVEAIPPFESPSKEEKKKKKKKYLPLLRLINSPISSILIYNAQFHKNRNISGILISVQTETQTAILSADFHYEQISTYVIPDLVQSKKHSLVVPHHGGEAGSLVYNYQKTVYLENAVISIGKNGYKHPLQRVIDFLRKKGFKLLQTNIKNEDIIIELS